jgi:DegV family protein with EDD domain
MIATLEFLAKGGRIGGAAALLGSVLQIKPILVFKDGQVDQFDKERTHRRAIERLKTLVLSEIDHTDGNLTVGHAGAPEAGLALAQDLQQQLGLARVPIYDMPPAIVTHAGPGVLAVGFFTNRNA